MIRRLALGLGFVLAVLSAASPALAALAHVQSKSTGCGAATTCAATFTSNVGAGNLIAVYVWMLNTSETFSSVTDSLGNTYTAVDNPTTCSTSDRGAMFYAKNITGGANTVTANFSGSTSIRTIIIHEISGADTTAPLDGSTPFINCQTSPGTGTDAVTSPSITTSSNGDYIFSATAGGVPGCVATHGTGFTVAEGEGAYYCTTSEYQIQGSAGAIAGTFTINTSGETDTLTGVMAFKPPGAAATTPCVLGGGIVRTKCPG